MSDKEAKVKISVSAEGFKRGLKDAEGEAKKTGGGIQKALGEGLSKGLKGGIDSLKSALSTIKSTVGSIAGIGGLLGFGELARGAIAAEGGYRKLAFAIRTGTGAAVEWRDIQKQVQATALATGQSGDELRQVFEDVFAETGDAEFAQKTLKGIATAATGAHEPVETIGKIAGTLNEKFGVTADQMNETLATVVGLGHKGGVSVGDMAEKLGLIGASAKEAGLSGQAGFAKVVGMLNLADNANGSFKKGIGAVTGLMEQLGDKTARTKTGMLLGTNLKGDVTQQIGQILSKTKGNKDQLAKAFGGESLKLLVDLGRQYASAFDSTTGNVKAKTAAGLEAYQQALASAGKSNVSYSDLQKEAADEMETGEKKMAVAMEKMKQAFSKPEVTAAIEKLLGSLPKLADILADLVGFAAKHPVLAGAAAGAGVFGQGALSQGIPALIDALKKGGGAAAGPAGGAGAGVPGVPGAGVKPGVGSALAVVGAGLAGFEVGKALFDLKDDLQGVHEARSDNLDRRNTVKKDAFGFEDVAFKQYNQGYDAATGEDKYGDTMVATGGTGDYDQGGSGGLGGKGGGIANAYKSLMRLKGQRSDEDTIRDSLGSDETRIRALAGMQKTAQPGGDGGRSRQDAALLAEMLGSRELKVRVVNPDEIRADGGAPGSPAPGRVAR